jgi:hypothetical protein
LQNDELSPAPPLPDPPLPELADPEPDPLDAPPEDAPPLEGAPEPDEEPDEPEAPPEPGAPPDGVALEEALGLDDDGVVLVLVDLLLVVEVDVVRPPRGTVRPVAGFVPVPGDPPPPQAATRAAVRITPTKPASFRAACC